MEKGSQSASDNLIQIRTNGTESYHNLAHGPRINLHKSKRQRHGATIAIEQGSYAIFRIDKLVSVTPSKKRYVYKLR